MQAELKSNLIINIPFSSSSHVHLLLNCRVFARMREVSKEAGQVWKLKMTTYCGDFNLVIFQCCEISILWRFQYCGDFNIVEISILWRFQYCGDFNIVRFQSREISILWRFQHCEILISWYFNLRKLCVTSRNLEKWVKRVGRSLRRLGPGGRSRKHASSQNWI